MPSRLLALLESRLPFTQRRMVEDLGPSLAFALSRRKQRQALVERARCQTIQDYLAFANRWLGVGAVQIPEEIAAVLNYIAESMPRYICEIGTEDGGTTFLLSQVFNTAELIIGIDLYVQNRPQLYRLCRNRHKLVLINGSSDAPPTLRRVKETLKNNQLDVLFIDGDHRYEGVKGDFMMYKDLVRENGFILFHDIVQDHGVRFGKITPAFSGGVPALWKELQKIYPSREFVRDPEQNGLGIGVIRYSSSIELPDWFVNKP